MHLLSTRQILQSELRVEGNKSSSTFCNKSSDVVILATPNLWGNIQIVRTHILNHNVFNSLSFAIRHLDFETLHYCFGYISDEVMYHVLNNVENRKFISQHRNISAIVILLERCTNTVSLRMLFSLVSL